MNNCILDDSLQEMIHYYQDRDEHKKHLKGYMYDSLVYRYKYVREKLAELEYKEQSTIGNNRKSLPFYRDLAERDIMRFIQILDEAIGPHD